jgi:hypothetical protein
MNIQKATRSYETWLAANMRVVKSDLSWKHAEMSASLFLFFRGTYYRWLQRWPEACKELSKAPRVLAVGDLHVENFGTWRDREGRLIWGCNDFDEAYPEAYTLDLVRLATSAHLACREGHLTLAPDDACAQVLGSYTEALASGGKPFVLAERHKWLRDVAQGKLRAPAPFWEKMRNLKAPRGGAPANVRKVLADLLPERGLSFDLKHRLAGMGSLGRPRIVALAYWRGGYVAREAKALLPSAHIWARGGPERIWYNTIIQRSVRVPDPYVLVSEKWILRRLAPDCSRIELTSLPKYREEDRLLSAMGWETANIHLGTPKAIAAIRRDLRKRGKKWLHAAAKEMVAAVTEDWKAWRKR